MAGTIGTNVTTDGSTEFDLMKTILAEIEKMIDSRETNERARLNKMMAEYLLQNHTPVCANVPGKNAQEMENILIAQGMPYISFPNEKGDRLFIVREEDKEKFFELQKQVYSRDGSRFSSQTEKNMLLAGQSSKEKTAIKLTVKNKAELSILQAKLSNHDIVYGVSENDKECSVIISPNSLVSMKGKDLISFEMEWAMTQTFAGKTFGFSKGGDINLNKLRTAQGAYDESQIRSVLDNENAILTDVNGNSNYYIEKNKEVITVYKKDENGDWQQEAQLDGKDGREAFVRNYAAKINDMYSYTEEELKDGYAHTNMTKAEAQANIPEGFKRPSTSKLSPKDQAIKSICDKEFDGEGGLITLLKKKALNNIKDKYPESKIKAMTQEQLYKLVKEETARLLEPDNAKETPEYYKFLNENSTDFSVDEKRTFCEELAGHFVNEHEKDDIEIDVSRISIRDRLREIAQAERDRAAKETERNQDQERTAPDKKADKDKEREEPNPFA